MRVHVFWGGGFGKKPEGRGGWILCTKMYITAVWLCLLICLCLVYCCLMSIVLSAYMFVALRVVCQHPRTIKLILIL